MKALIRRKSGGFLRKHIIAGIDPGSTFGIAILDLSGRSIALKSTSGGMGEAVRIIESFGTPSMIATDVAPVPQTVQKIASYFSCRVFSPWQNLREEEKRAIARGAPAANSHERDAYACAVLAYRHHANRLRSIDALSELSEEEKSRLKHLILRGYRLKDAFISLEEKEKAPSPQGQKPADGKAHPARLSAEELKERAVFLARENANLRMLVKRLEAEKEELSRRLSALQNEYRRSLMMDSELRRLKFRLRQALERISGRHGSKREQQEGRKASPPSQPAPQASEGQPSLRSRAQSSLNESVERELDIERIVMEYRRARDGSKR
ncbi:MAG: DUF460 domain-containing protein [Candidatus Micrarchaeota archaeon]|nr:DUF460 domain-containing protein [Candidatus Micrarchaeota archaeon]